MPRPGDSSIASACRSCSGCSLLNVIAIVWVAFMVVLMSLPPNGLAGVTLSATCAVLFVAWFGGVRNVFKGPRR